MRSFLRKLVRIIAIIATIILIVVAVCLAIPAMGTSLYAVVGASTFYASVGAMSAFYTWVALGALIVCFLLDPEATMAGITSAATRFGEVVGTVVTSVAEPIVSTVGGALFKGIGVPILLFVGAYFLLKKSPDKKTNKEVVRDANQQSSSVGRFRSTSDRRNRRNQRDFDEDQYDD